MSVLVKKVALGQALLRVLVLTAVSGVLTAVSGVLTAVSGVLTAVSGVSPLLHNHSYRGVAVIRGQEAKPGNLKESNAVWNID
jgi:hypothetical protein